LTACAAIRYGGSSERLTVFRGAALFLQLFMFSFPEWQPHFSFLAVAPANEMLFCAGCISSSASSGSACS